MLRFILKTDDDGANAIGSFFFGSNKFQPGNTVPETSIFSVCLFSHLLLQCCQNRMRSHGVCCDVDTSSGLNQDRSILEFN